MVAGQDAEAAGVLRQHLGDAELGREVGDRRAATSRPSALVPAAAGRGSRCRSSCALAEPAQERRRSSASAASRSGADRAEQPHRVVPDLVPDVRVDAANRSATRGCQDQRRFMASSPSGASGSGRTVRTVNRRMRFHPARRYRRRPVPTGHAVVRRMRHWQPGVCPADAMGRFVPDDRTHPDPRRAARRGLRPLAGQGRRRRDVPVSRHRLPRGPRRGRRQRRARATRGGRKGPARRCARSAPGTDRWAAEVTPDRRGRWTLRRRGVERPVRAPGAHDAEIKIAAGQSTSSSMLEEGARLLERRGQAAPAGAGRRGAARRRGRRCATTSRPVEARLAAPTRRRRRDARRAPAARPRHRERRGCRCGSTASARSTAPGTSSSRAPRAPSRPDDGVPVGHLPHRDRAAAGRRGDGLRRRLPAADPPDRHDVPQGPEQHARRPARTTPASPWAIGVRRGRPRRDPPRPRHDRGLRRVRRARPRELGIEVALDLALQCSPDHPWVTEHPEWFTTRADGTIAYAENPPKKYQDIYPLNFDHDPDGHLRRGAARRPALDRPRRADLPGRQPAHQAGRVLGVADRRGPADRPRRAVPGRGVHPAGDDARRSARSASTSPTRTSPGATRSGSSRSTSPSCASRPAHYMRPNFFVNTPGHPARLPAVRRPAGVQDPGRAGRDAVAVLGRLLRLRAVRARRRPAGQRGVPRLREVPVRPRDWAAAEAEGRSLAPYLTELNAIRRAHPALQRLRNLRFHRTDNDQIIVLLQATGTARSDDTVLVVVNLDPHGVRETTVHLDLPALGLDWDDSFDVARRAHRRRPTRGASTTTSASTRSSSRPTSSPCAGCAT